METFTQAKSLIENPDFVKQRRKALACLDQSVLDPPLIPIVIGFNELDHCFTLQSCYGHFLYEGQTDKHNLTPLPTGSSPGPIEYRIAYLALCIENSEAGRTLIKTLQDLVDIDPQSIQFGSADWFWDRQVNTYVLQVEPDRFKHLDRAVLGFDEALSIENVRRKFFDHLKKILRIEQADDMHCF